MKALATHPLVVITGGAKGIGLELVRKYRSQGYRVACVDLQKTEELESILDPDTRYFECDISNGNAFEAAGQEIFHALGRPDHWINNAGVALVGPFQNYDPIEIQKLIDINVKGTLFGTRIALNLMQRPERGVIANVASLNGHIPAPFLSAYSASKFAVVGFTRSLREEKKLARSAIKICLISPGFVATQMIQSHSQFKIPKHLSFLVESPKNVAAAIFAGMKRGDTEISIGKSTLALTHLHRFFPALLEGSSRLLVAENMRELLGLKRIIR